MREEKNGDKNKREATQEALVPEEKPAGPIITLIFHEKKPFILWRFFRWLLLGGKNG